MKRDNPKSNTESGSSTANSPYQSVLSFEDTVPPLFHPPPPTHPRAQRGPARHGRSQSATSIATSEPDISPELVSYHRKRYASVHRTNPARTT